MNANAAAAETLLFAFKEAHTFLCLRMFLNATLTSFSMRFCCCQCVVVSIFCPQFSLNVACRLSEGLQNNTPALSHQTSELCCERFEFQCQIIGVLMPFECHSNQTVEIATFLHGEHRPASTRESSDLYHRREKLVQSASRVRMHPSFPLSHPATTTICVARAAGAAARRFPYCECGFAASGTLDEGR